MTTYKAITTITWKFDSEDSEKDALEKAKNQLDKILNNKPIGSDFDGFSVQVDIAKMKDRKKLIHLGCFSTEDVFPYITKNESKREYSFNGKSYLVKMNSDRYHLFKENSKCVSCGIVGTKMILDMNPGDSSPHFNLYAEENGRLVLMTKDHKLAKSKGGTDKLDNFVTCCSICNNLKGAYNLNYEQVYELRRINDNADKLTRKELHNLINKRREEMALSNSKEDN